MIRIRLAGAALILLALLGVCLVGRRRPQATGLALLLWLLPLADVITFGELRGPAGQQTVSGILPAVEHADQAARLLLAAEVDGSPALIAVDPRGDQVEVRRLAAFDLAGAPCRVELRQAPFELLAAGDVLLDRVGALLAVAMAARRVLAEVTPEGVRYAMGFRPSLPDSLPVIGRSPRSSSVYLAFGHGHLGLTLGPVTGRIIADLVAERRPVLDTAPFRADRF